MPGTLVTTVVNIHDDGGRAPYDVYVGRSSPFGNPFHIGRDGSREHVVDKYRLYFQDAVRTDARFRELLTSLRGKRLGCHCVPLLCHAQLIAAYVNATV